MGGSCQGPFSGNRHSAHEPVLSRSVLDVQPIQVQDYAVVHIAGGKFRAPTRLEVRFDDEPDIPYGGRLFIELQGGRYVCTVLTLYQPTGGVPVTTAGLRAVPIAQLVRRSVQGRVTAVKKVERPVKGVVKLTMGSGPEGQPGRRRRRRGEDVDVTAVVYSLAAMCGEPPTKAVADELQIPLGTARRLVAQAREAGYLPQTS